MSLTLRDVIARGTPIEWFEAVAIVQELCASVLNDAGKAGPRVPDLPGAVLTADGGVTVTDPGSAEQSAVFRLAHVLNALLGGGTPPVQLRLLVLMALSPESGYKSLLELSQALEYYERPDRRGVNRIVYEKALSRPAVETEVPPLPEKPETPTAAPGSPVSRRRRRELAILVACLVVGVALVATAAWWSKTASGARVLTDTRATVSGAVASAVGAIEKQFASKPPEVVEAPAAPASVEQPKPARRRLLRALRPARSLAQGGLAPVVALPTAPPGPALPAENTERFDDVVYLNLSSSPDARAVAGQVYSAADQDVRPPVAVRPRLPSEVPPGVRLEELTRLELLVTATGEVESVKIVSGPRTLNDGMMLSAVKAWKFAPATLDGIPVPYRHLLYLTQ